MSHIWKYEPAPRPIPDDFERAVRQALLALGCALIIVGIALALLAMR